MRVSKVETYVIGGSWRNWVIVRILTDDGLEGPVTCPLGPAGNPFLEQSDFLGA